MPQAINYEDNIYSIDELERVIISNMYVFQVKLINLQIQSDVEVLNRAPVKVSKHLKRNLPHKKRIAKKLNSNQPFDEDDIITEEDPAKANPVYSFSCTICTCVFSQQMEFYLHCKLHYEPTEQQHIYKEMVNFLIRFNAFRFK